MMFGFETEYKLIKFLEEVEEYDIIDRTQNNTIMGNNIVGENFTMQKAPSHIEHVILDNDEQDMSSSDSSEEKDDEENQLMVPTALSSVVPIAIVSSQFIGSKAQSSERELNREMWKWGVNMHVHGHIGTTKLKISIQDVHLVFQICSFASDSILQDGIQKLQDINEGLKERESLKKLSSKEQHNVSKGEAPDRGNNQQKHRSSSLTITSGRDETVYKTSRQFKSIEEESSAGSEAYMNDDEIFDGMIERIHERCNFEGTMASQMNRLSASSQFMLKIADGYTKKTFFQRKNLMEFLVNDVMVDETNNQAAEILNEIDDNVFGEEMRRRTIMRMTKQMPRRATANFNKDYQKVEQSIVIEEGIEETASPSPPLRDGSASDKGGKEGKSLITGAKDHSPNEESDVKAEGGPLLVSDQLKIPAKLPNQKKQTDEATGQQFPNLQAGTSQAANEKRARISSNESFLNPSRTSNRKSGSRRESMAADVVSEFFYSCAGKDKDDAATKSMISKRPTHADQIKVVKKTYTDDYPESQKPSRRDSESMPKIQVQTSENSSDEDDFQDANEYLVDENDQQREDVQEEVHRASVASKRRSNHAKELMARPGKTPNRLDPQNTIHQNSELFLKGSLRESVIASSQHENERIVVSATKFPNCMDHIREKETLMSCDNMSVLFINDFDKGFTPVLEFEIASLEMVNKADSNDENAEIEVNLPMFTANYFNLELGEWEPLLEQMQMKMTVHETVSQKIIQINFNKSIILNITQSGLRNFIFTYQSWMATPDFLFQTQTQQLETFRHTDEIIEEQNENVTQASGTFVLATKEGEKSQNSATSGSGNSLSINSDSYEDKEVQLQITNAKPKSMKQLKNTDMEFDKKIEEKKGDELDTLGEKYDWYQEDNQIETVTPFTIVNQTNCKFTVVQGGIVDELNDGRTTSPLGGNTSMRLGGAAQQIDASFTSKHTFARQSSNPFAYHANANKKLYNVEPGASCDYAVTYAQLVNNQNNQKETISKVVHQPIQPQQTLRRSLQGNFTGNLSPMSQHHQALADSDNQLLDNSVEPPPSNFKMTSSIGGGGQISQALENEDKQQVNLKFKNTVVVGIRIDETDFIRAIDLNEISMENPFIYTLSPSHMLQRKQTTLSQGSLPGNILQRSFDKLSAADFIKSQEESDFELSKDNRHIRFDQYMERNRVDKNGQFFSKLFFGVVLEKMRKVLVIRTPYVFHNKTQMLVEMRIIEPTTQDEQARFTLQPGDKYALDSAFFYSSIQVKILDQTINSQANSADKSAVSPKSPTSPLAQKKMMAQKLKSSRGFSEDVQIKDLMNLDLNNGPGTFVAGKDDNSLCTCIKRQPGELNGTTDLVLLPTIIIKNCLPCYLQIKRTKRHSDENTAKLLEANEDETQIYNVDKSEEKQFYTFTSSGNSTEVHFKFRVDGFIWSEQISLNFNRAEEIEVEIHDRHFDTLKIGMRVQLQNAGYQVTFFAHACLMVETVRLLNNDQLKFYYQEGLQAKLKTFSATGRKRIAGESEVGERRYIMCNRDQEIVMGMTENNTESKFFSNPLDIKQAGKQVDFSISTQTVESLKRRGEKAARQLNKKYDYVLSTSLSLADAQQTIYTKMVLLSPKYVLVNQMKTPIEVAQIGTISESYAKKLMIGDKREWYWQDNLQEDLVMVRKCMPESAMDTSFSHSSSGEDSGYNQSSSDEDNFTPGYKRRNSSSSDEPESPNFKGGKKSPGKNPQIKRAFSETDKVTDWEWSRGFSLGVQANEDMIISVMIREDIDREIQAGLKTMLRQTKRKIIRVTKKLINSTVFIIFEEEDPKFPMFRIVNECQNVKIQFEQMDLFPEKSPDKLGPDDSCNFAFYDPEIDRKLQMTLDINKNDPEPNEPFVDANNLWYKRIEIINCGRDTHENVIDYFDMKQRAKQILITIVNDGQTKTIRLCKVDQEERDDMDYDASASYLKSNRHFMDRKSGEFPHHSSQVQPLIDKPPKPQQKVIMHLDLRQLSVSLVGKVQEFYKEKVVSRRKEIMLVTIKGLRLESQKNYEQNAFEYDLKMDHFQIDNQTDRNPLYQQIFLPKVFNGQGDQETAGRRNRNSRTGRQNEFFKLSIIYKYNEKAAVTFVEKFHCRMGDSALQFDDEFLVSASYSISHVTQLLNNHMTSVHPIFMKDSYINERDDAAEQVNQDSILSHELTASLISHQQKQQDKFTGFNNGQLLSQNMRTNSSGLKQSNQLMNSGESNQSRTRSSKVKFREDNRLIEEEGVPNFQYEDDNENPKGLRQTHRSNFSDSSQQRRKQNWTGQKNEKHQEYGVILTEEKVCEITLENAPINQRRWFQQEIKSSQEKLYLKQFEVEPIVIDLSLVFKTKLNAAEDRDFIGPLRYLKTSGLSLVNVDEATFRLGRFKKKQLYVGKEDMIELARKFYSQKAINEFKKLTFSIGFLGSPRTLLNYCLDGFTDFVEMPRDGYEDGDFIGGISGIASGTMSLTKNVTVGMISTFQVLSSGFSQVFLLLTTDKDYTRTREDQMRIEKPKNFVEGFGYGCNTAMSASWSAAKGVVTRPWIEGKRYGMKIGVPLGIWQGASGLILKPMSGGFDLLSKTAEGCKNTIRAFEVKQQRERVRYPRPFYGYSRQIKSFSENDALLVNAVLSQIQEGKYEDNHYLEMKLIKPKGVNPHFLLLTEEHLFLIEAAQKALVWQIQTLLIQEVEIVQNGIVIKLQEEYEGRWAYVLPMDDKQSNEIAIWLNAIAIEFN